MANREALRELPGRLASRLQAARSEGVRLSWLAVEAAGTKYLFPLHQSGEIFPWENALWVPYTQPWFLGVANLRGGLFGVVDLAGYVAFSAGEPVPAPHPESARIDGYLIALNAALEVTSALLLDRLEGLRSVESFATSAAADPGAPPWFGNVYTDSTGVRWQEINLELLSQQAPFLSITA